MWVSGFRGAMSFALGVSAVYVFVENNVGKIILTLIVVYCNCNVIFMFFSFKS